jgi:hypothetical protein
VCLAIASIITGQSSRCNSWQTRPRVFCRHDPGPDLPPSQQADPSGAQTSDEPERQIKLPGGGLAGAAEDPALLLYAGLKREPPDRPPPGVPLGV